MQTNILITGVGHGIGSSLAYYLNKQGFHLFLASRGDTVESVAEKIGCHSWKADLNNYKECEKAVEVATEAMGSLDGVVNVAGNYFSTTEIEKYPEDTFQEALLNNARTFYNMARASVPVMKKQGFGAIIGFAAADNVLLNSNPGYAAGKGAVYSMIRELSRELIPYNITVNGIAPGFIEKDFIDQGVPQKLGTPGRYPPSGVNRAVEFLLLSELITGQIINVAGGHNMNIGSGIK
ncbi:MAG: SDR family oxidoreductase [Ferroplasma sp.]|uniref:SDR family NAD(P)-dependent oxidoreductase n=1 Tax=Ferroplasma sp. TaxID=2591003 RepID=UPI0028156A2C|nr:SDR family oxidoreductase [Ferroplasma sp.]WMT50766.1 MAG: SDR family oxidoreductase [Ferroplasma sp.]